MSKNRGTTAWTGILCTLLLPGAPPATAASPPAAAPPPAIVANGGFEDWQAAPDNLQKLMACPQTPAGWSVQPRSDPSDCSLRRDAAVHRGGRFSVRLANTNTKSGLSIAQRIDAEPECRYVIRLWLKGDRIDAYHPKGVIVHAAASSQTDKRDAGLWSGILRHADKSPSPHCGTFDWQELVCTFDTPVGTRSMLFLVELRGAGVVWLDDVQVTRLEKCIEVESY